MTSRERILRVLNHQIPDRVPIHDAPWPSAVQRWHREGLPEDLSPAEYFGYEFAQFEIDRSPRHTIRTVEQNDEYVIRTTQHGGKRKNHRDYSSTPEIIEWPIKTKADWPEMKKLLKPDFKRVDWATGLANNKTAYEEGKFLCLSGGCGYNTLLNYMHAEQLLMSMAEDPAWIKEMIMTLTENTIVMAELMLNNGFRFDAAFIYNDMGYKNGLLFSPDIYQKTHYDADRLLYAYFHSKGMKTILHSCGNVSELVPVFIETGLDCLQPLEVKAGMDVVGLKKQYGDRLAFMGGIDVRLMAEEDPSKIEEEIKTKFEAVKKNGGYIYHSDHSVPKNVSFQQYCRVMELVKKYGAYPEYEELRKQAEAPDAVIEPKSAAGKQAEQKPKKGMFGRKAAKETPAAVVKPAAPEISAQKPRQPDEEGKKKGFKLPFGKKK